MFTNGHYFGILDEAEKLALHLEVLLAVIDDIQYRFRLLDTEGTRSRRAFSSYLN